MATIGFMYIFVLITTLSTLGISTSSSNQERIQCNATNECYSKDYKNPEDSGSNITACCVDSFCQFGSTCQVNSSDTNSSLSNTNNSIKDSRKTPGNSSTIISNDTTPVYSGNITTNLNQSRWYDSCSKNSDCKSAHKKCLSLVCINGSPKNEIKDCKACESISCTDGRCYNLTSPVLATAISKEQGITQIQLVLLFGSMGGILVVIIIVYCVKTFTDNRRRQYLLKHGVWENPPEKDGKEKEEKIDSDAKSDASRQQKKLEVPTITVETETDSSKQKKKNKGNLKDEITDTAGLEEYGKTAVKDSKNLKVIAPDQPAKIEGDVEPNSPRKTESKPNQNANHLPATQKPYSDKTKIGKTIGSPKKTSLPTAWNKESEKTPLSESPKPKRFTNLKKNKDSPNKIIANGNPDKSSRFGKQKGNSPPVQLCEPENFSDFGM